MYHVLIAAFLLLTVLEPAHAGQRQDIFRHAKAATVLIVGVNDAAHSISLGSGFFVDASGLLVTNAHVIEESARLYVYVLDREIYATPDVVARDPVWIWQSSASRTHGPTPSRWQRTLHPKGPK